MNERSLHAILLASLVVWLSACSPRAPEPAGADDEDVQATATAQRSCTAASDIVLRGELHGAVSGELIGRASNTECRGMPRPNDRGLRLHFRTTGSAAGTPFVVILGIDGIGPGDTGASLRTTVTLIDEDAERFFSTAGQPSCFSDIRDHTLSDADARSAITGVLWCTAAIPQINGQLSVRVSELFFEGAVQWPHESQ